MATCKDCLRHKACSADRNNDNYFMLIGCVNVESNCIDFVDKSNFVEVVHGRWLTDRFGLERSICSVCDACYEGDGGNYFPNCGADMRGEEDG